MTVELAKLVEGEIVQRARFTITPQPGDGTQVQIIIHRDDQSLDSIDTEGFVTVGEAYAHIYRTFMQHFTAFSDDEIFGCEVTWDVGAHDDIPEAEIDLAKLIAGAVSEQLEEEIEELELDDLRSQGQPITWGLLDYETGAFTPQYTEYPGNPTKIVHADGRIEFVDEEGSPVDPNDMGADRR